MENGGNLKLVLYAIISCLGVVFVYLFTIFYLYVISPYNIRLSISLWPFVSDSQMAKMYQSAVVEMSFEVDDDFEAKEVTVMGVNVNKNGYIIVPYNDLKNATEDSSIKIVSKTGSVYSGEVIFGDETYNLAVVKCSSLNGKTVKLPYVSLGSWSNLTEGKTLYSVSSDKSSTYQTCSVSSTDVIYSVTKNAESTSLIDYTIENGFVVDFRVDTTYMGGILFDATGKLYGISYDDTLKVSSLDKGQYYILPTYTLGNIIDDIVSCGKKNTVYTNANCKSLVGFDKYEAEKISDTGSSLTDYNTNWSSISGAFESYYIGQSSGIFLCEKFGDIPAGSVLTKVSLNGSIYTLTSKYDLWEIFYAIDSDDKVSYYYKEWTGSRISDREKVA